MPDYQITLATSAEHEYRKLPPTVKVRVTQAIDNLQSNPGGRGAIKLQTSKDLYRIRVGDYRVVFHIYDAKKVVDIVHIRHRRDIYK